MKRADGRASVSASTLVAAAGGFEANIEWLKQYWGEAAENFLIRGTPYNRGSILKMLLEKGVQEVGDPTQCHGLSQPLYEEAVNVLTLRGVVEIIGLCGYYTMVSMTLNTFEFGLPDGETSELA